MRTRDAVIEYQKPLDDAGTLIKDLDIVDPVSALYLEFQATNGTTSNKGNFISDVITKIEVVDGSQVLYGVNLSQLEALQFYKLGKAPTMFPSEHGSGIQRHGVLLMFGRHLWDRDYAMDFTRYRNPQLKITSNLSAVATVSATTAFATGTLVATIVAKVMQDVTKPSQYLRAKEIDSFVSAGSGDKRTELVYDYPYRMLLLRAFKQQSDIDEVITDLKLTCDTDNFIPITRKVKQLDAEALAQFGLCIFKHDIFQHHQSAFREINNKENLGRWATFADVNGYIVNVEYEWSSEGKLDILTNAGAVVSSDVKLTGMECGHAPHATLPVLFGERDRPDSWFDPKPYKKVEVVLTQNVISAACQVVLEQSVPVGS
jgi:hypothetical protein